MQHVERRLPQAATAKLSILGTRKQAKRLLAPLLSVIFFSCSDDHMRVSDETLRQSALALQIENVPIETPVECAKVVATRLSENSPGRRIHHLPLDNIAEPIPVPAGDIELRVTLFPELVDGKCSGNPAWRAVVPEIRVLPGQTTQVSLFFEALNGEIIITDSEFEDIFNDPPAPPPILRLEFDEGAGNIAYDAVGSHDATLAGTSWVSGKEGTGIQIGLISGSNWGSATIPYADDLRLTGSWSLATWFLPICDFTIPGNDCGMIWAQSAYWRFNTGISVVAGQNNISVFMYTGFGSPNWDGWKRIDAIPVSPWDDGEYHHLHVTFDSDALTLRIYVDGALMTEESTMGPAIYNQQASTVIGRLGSGSDLWVPYDGALDELTVWNEVVAPQYPTP